MRIGRLTALGDLTGTWLPTSFMELAYAPGSPYYSVAGEGCGGLQQGALASKH